MPLTAGKFHTCRCLWPSDGCCSDPAKAFIAALQPHYRRQMVGEIKAAHTATGELSHLLFLSLSLSFNLLSSSHTRRNVPTTHPDTPHYGTSHGNNTRNTLPRNTLPRNTRNTRNTPSHATHHHFVLPLT